VADERPPEGMQELYRQAILTMTKNWSQEKKDSFRPRLKGKSLRDQMREIAREEQRGWVDPPSLQRFPGAQLEDI